MSRDAQFIDIFEREQTIFDHAIKKINQLNSGEPFDPAEFAALAKEYGKVLKQLRRVTKISDRATENLNTSKLELLDMVHFDALTGIYNRRYLDETICRNIKSISRSKGQISVMMIDVDFFKRYNDTYGHSEGDECLRLVAKAIADSLTRADDYAARYGGEEFAVVLPNTDESGARVIANRLLHSVRALQIPHEKNEVANCVTISIGVMTTYAQHTHTKEMYFSCVDQALYKSKHNGRNRYTYIDFMEGHRHEF